jgi:hypothetical protein
MTEPLEERLKKKMKELEGSDSESMKKEIVDLRVELEKEQSKNRAGSLENEVQESKYLDRILDKGSSVKETGLSILDYVIDVAAIPFVWVKNNTKEIALFTSMIALFGMCTLTGYVSYKNKQKANNAFQQVVENAVKSEDWTGKIATGYKKSIVFYDANSILSSPSRTVTLDRAFDIGYLHWSENGKKIIVCDRNVVDVTVKTFNEKGSLTRTEEKKIPYLADILVYDLETDRATVVVLPFAKELRLGKTRPGYVHSIVDPYFSADYKRILFKTQDLAHGIDTGVYSVKLDGSGLKKVSAFEEKGSNQSITSDGRYHIITEEGFFTFQKDEKIKGMLTKSYPTFKTNIRANACAWHHTQRK